MTMEEFGRRFRNSAPAPGRDYWQRIDDAIADAASTRDDDDQSRATLVNSRDTSRDVSSPTYVSVLDYPRKSFALSAMAAGFLVLLVAGGVIWAVASSDDSGTVIDSADNGADNQAVLGGDTTAPDNESSSTDGTTPSGQVDEDSTSAAEKAETTLTTTASTTTETTADVSSSSTTVQQETASPNPAVFQSPSGNIHCIMSVDEATCAYIGQALWERGGASDWLDDGEGLSDQDLAAYGGCTAATLVGMTVHREPSTIPVEGRRIEESVRPLCGDDSALLPEPVVTLAYGDSSTVGVFTCESATAGVACRNNNTAKGFVVARRELSLLLAAGDGWKQHASEQARALQATQPQPREISGDLLDELGVTGGLLGMKATGATCHLRPAAEDLFEASVHCGAGAVGDDWNPSMCTFGDLDGFFLGPDGPAGPSCVTDAWLLGAPAEPVARGEVWQLREGIRCGTPDGNAIVCWNNQGNGIQVGGGEFSIFFDAFS